MLANVTGFVITGKVPNELLREIQDLETGLSTNSRIFESDYQQIEESCGNGLGLVKDEMYTGNIVTQKVIPGNSLYTRRLWYRMCSCQPTVK